MLLLFRRLLDTYQTRPGQGLPIGNLTSLHFANFYLNPLDRNNNIGFRVVLAPSSIPTSDDARN